MTLSVFVISHTTIEAKALQQRLKLDPTKTTAHSFPSLARAQYEKLRGIETLILVADMGVYIPEQFAPKYLYRLDAEQVAEGLCLGTCLIGQCLCERSNLRVPDDPFQIRIDIKEV